MVYPNEPFYVVGGGFGLGKSGDMSSYGFSIGLDPKFAKKFYEREITDEEYEVFDKKGRAIIKNIFDEKDDSMIDSPYRFLRNGHENPTLLLKFCRVAWGACELGVDGMKLNGIKRWEEYTMSGLIEYGPHNVDTLEQASGLLTLWNEWAINAFALTSDD